MEGESGAANGEKNRGGGRDGGEGEVLELGIYITTDTTTYLPPEVKTLKSPEVEIRHNDRLLFTVDPLSWEDRGVGGKEKSGWVGGVGRWEGGRRLKRGQEHIALRVSLSGTFLQTLPEMVTPLKGHYLSPRSCPATRSAPSERFGY